MDLLSHRDAPSADMSQAIGMPPLSTRVTAHGKRAAANLEDQWLRIVWLLPFDLSDMSVPTRYYLL